MAMQIGTADIRITAAHGDSAPVEVATVSIPVHATLDRKPTRNGEAAATVRAGWSRRGFRKSMKKALRAVARAL